VIEQAPQHRLRLRRRGRFVWFNMWRRRLDGCTPTDRATVFVGSCFTRRSIAATSNSVKPEVRPHTRQLPRPCPWTIACFMPASFASLATIAIAQRHECGAEEVESAYARTQSRVLSSCHLVGQWGDVWPFD
jgi:hypothetical protein